MQQARHFAESASSQDSQKKWQVANIIRITVEASGRSTESWLGPLRCAQVWMIPSCLCLRFTNPLCAECMCRPEQHILLFRRPIGTDPRTGLVDPDKARATKEQYHKQYEMICEPKNEPAATATAVSTAVAASAETSKSEESM